MIVVIEGPDGAGKTTLAHAVIEAARAKGYEAEYTHSGPPGPDPLTDYENVIYGSGEILAVVDRLHWGEMVYGVTRRDRPKIDLYDFVSLDTSVERHGGVVALVTPHWSMCASAILKRGEQLDEEQLRSELDKFEYLAKLVQGKHVVQFNARQEPEVMALAVIQKLESRNGL